MRKSVYRPTTIYYNSDQSQRTRLNVVVHLCFTYIKKKGSKLDRRGASKDADSRVAKAWSKWRKLTGVICDKKVPRKMKLLIYQTVIRPTLLYDCDTSPMSVKDKKKTYGNNRDENGAMGNVREPVGTSDK